MSTIAEIALSLTFIRRKFIFDHSSMTMIISTSLSFFELFYSQLKKKSTECNSGKVNRLILYLNGNLFMAGKQCKS